MFIPGVECFKIGMSYLYLVRFNAIKTIHLESFQDEDLRSSDRSSTNLIWFKDLGSCLVYGYKTTLSCQAKEGVQYVNLKFITATS